MAVRCRVRRLAGLARTVVVAPARRCRQGVTQEPDQAGAAGLAGGGVLAAGAGAATARAAARARPHRSYPELVAAPGGRPPIEIMISAERQDLLPAARASPGFFTACAATAPSTTATHARSAIGLLPAARTPDRRARACRAFHRHPVYDLVLLRAHEQGMEEMARQADAIVAETHPHQRADRLRSRASSYHARLPREIAAIRADPFIAARPIPTGLVEDAQMMLAMDQFKDIRGFTSYAALVEGQHRRRDPRLVIRRVRRDAGQPDPGQARPA